MVKNEDLVKITQMLVKLVNFIDKSIDKDVNGCLHEENVSNLTTMGTDYKKFKCFDCGKIWEEKFEADTEEFAQFSDTIGVRSRRN